MKNQIGCYTCGDAVTLNSTGLGAPKKSAKIAVVKLLQWEPLFESFVKKMSSYANFPLIKFVPQSKLKDICPTCSTKYLPISQNCNFSFLYEGVLTQVNYFCFDSFFLPSKANKVFWRKGSFTYPPL